MRNGDIHRFLCILLGTGFYSGYFPLAPGTAGTVVGIGFSWCFSQFSPAIYGITVLAFIFFSAWIAEGAEKIFQKKDDPSIVIDEIAGFLVAITWIPWNWSNVGIGFILFRFFDIIKPFPSRWIEKNLPGGWGITLDDIVAGIYANIILRGIIHWT